MQPGNWAFLANPSLRTVHTEAICAEWPPPSRARRKHRYDVRTVISSRFAL